MDNLSRRPSKDISVKQALYVGLSSFAFASAFLVYIFLFKSNFQNIDNNQDLVVAYPFIEQLVSPRVFGEYILFLRYQAIVLVLLLAGSLLIYARQTRSALVVAAWLSVTGLFLDLSGDIWSQNNTAVLSAVFNFLNGFYLWVFIFGLLYLGLLFPGREDESPRTEKIVHWIGGGLAGLFIVIISEIIPGLGDAAWAVLMVTFLGCVGYGGVGLFIRLRRNSGPGRQSLLALAGFYVYFVLSMVFSESVNAVPAYRFLVLHTDLALVAWLVLALYGDFRYGRIFASGRAPSGRKAVSAYLITSGVTAAVVLIALQTAAGQRNAVSNRVEELVNREIGHLLIDTDMGNDDVLALLYLLEHPGVTVDAVTVVGTGLVHCEPGIRNVHGLLELSGYPETPVTCGSEDPFGAVHAFPTNWRVAADRTWGLHLSSGGRLADSRTASELIRDYLRAANEPVTILALGPFTNFAEVFQLEPELVNKVGMLYMMGGAVNVPGNVYDENLGFDNRTAEWNIYADPVAARMVFETGVPITMIPLDATNDVPVDIGMFRAFEQDHETLVSRFVYNLMYINQGWILSGYYYLWDTLAAAALASPEVVEYKTYNLVIVTTPGPDYARTDVRDTGRPVRVAVRADADLFKALFAKILQGP